MKISRESMVKNIISGPVIWSLLIIAFLLYYHYLVIQKITNFIFKLIFKFSTHFFYLPHFFQNVERINAFVIPS